MILQTQLYTDAGIVEKDFHPQYPMLISSELIQFAVENNAHSVKAFLDGQEVAAFDIGTSI